ncbi:DUF636 domain protein [Polyplosphaeria fusca]|uniref:DUF636 domain protein n=1 Tax=Polyplosphaeria fusca TaxID=682080 RepID=A0A9P4UYI5_9PLEO|nr:DUF636 domain protein [Polyplosphaeria fusca]
MDDLRSLDVSCLCGAVTHSFSVPVGSLPLASNLCSCNISRRISGSLLTSYVNITHSPDTKRPNLEALTPYRSSTILTRHFCSTCGTQMYLEYDQDGHFEAATGTIQADNTDNIVEWKTQMWIEDTVDGGASAFVTKMNGQTLRRFLREANQSPEAPLDWKSAQNTKKGNIIKRSIRCHCHCNGVEFYISHPNEASTTAKSPWPDLIIPYHADSSDNPKNTSWWLPRPNRYLAGTCACKTCRRASGFDTTYWAFVPTKNITQDADGTKPFTRDQYWGTMKTYSSSPGVKRTFCGRCGANVFWDGRDSLVDVAVGLLDAPSGARAEEILSWWTERVSFCEDALNKGLIKGLETGLKQWAATNEGVNDHPEDA